MKSFRSRRSASGSVPTRSTRSSSVTASRPLPDEPVTFAPEADDRFESMSAEDTLRWAYEEFGQKLVLTCSWQKQSSVLVHMVSELGLGIDVVELDTHLFFRES